jgi:NAD(P)-dependent dehydrogenase (short-subunit alcohol dehydrogenase family)
MSRLVAVTGASAGIGRAAAVEFARRGDRVALIARGETGLDAAAAQIRELGVHVLAVPTDVADYAQVAAAVERIEDEMGPIDVWVNAAFSSVFARFDDVTPEEYRRATEVTYLGFVWGTMAVLPRMKRRGHGTIVHVGSSLAYRGVPLQTVYCGAKHATQGFHESLRCELLHDRSDIHVTMVQMPAVNTPQFSWVLSRLPKHAQPVPPIYQPEVAARAVVFAADHPKRREYWVASSTVGTLLANAVVPGLLDRYLGRNGFASQQTADPRPADQPANLWEPADGVDGRDFGVHGAFDDRSHAGSAQQWVAHRYPQLGSALAAVTAGGLAAWALTRRR